MRRLVNLSLPALLVACAPLVEHRAVPEQVLQGLDKQRLSKADFLRRLEAPSLRPVAPVTVPFRMTSGMPVVQVQVNGHGRVPMMIDTGASHTLLQARVALRHRVPVLAAADATVAMQGVVGRESARVGLATFQIGNWPLTDYPCMIRIHENRFRQGFGAVTFEDNLLGFDVARRHCTWLTLDYPQERATFGFDTPYEPLAHGRRLKLPMKLTQGVPLVTVSALGKTWEAVVDSGSFSGIEINEEVARRLGVENQGQIVEGLHLMAVGGMVSSAQAKLRVVKLPELRIGEEAFRDVEVDISPGPPRIGSYFLQDYRATFDFRRKLLWLEW